MSTIDFGKVSKERFVDNLETGFVLFLNIQSIRSHHDQLAAFLASFENQPIALCLCETWLSDTDCLSLYKLPNYRPIISRTRKSQRGGGCAIFVHDSLEYKIVKYETELEILTIDIQSQRTLRLSVVYRPPSMNYDVFQEKFDLVIENLVSSKLSAIVCGKFNVDVLKNRTSSSHLEYMKSFGLHIRNNAPTRVTPTSASCIDHMFTTMDSEVHTLESNISDHYSLLIDTKIIFRKHNISQTWSWYRIFYQESDRTAKSRNDLQVFVCTPAKIEKSKFISTS